MPRAAGQEIAGLELADDFFHSAVVIAVVMADGYEIEVVDSHALEYADRTLSRRAGVNQHGLALGRTDQDRVALPDVEHFDRDRICALPHERPLGMASVQETTQPRQKAARARLRICCLNVIA